MPAKRTAITVVVVALLGASVYGAGTAQAAAPSCVATGSHVLRTSPAGLPAAYRACAARIAAKLTAAGIEPTPQHTRAAWAAAVANHYAPYGTDRGYLTLDGLRRNRTMACSAYAMLAAELYGRIGGNDRDVIFIGWDGGAVGNHTQLMIGADMLVDATTGLVARTTLHHVAYAGPVADIADLGFNDVDGSTGRVARHVTGGFRDKVRNALQTGAFRRGHLIYTMTYRATVVHSRSIREAIAAGRDWRSIKTPTPVA